MLQRSSLLPTILAIVLLTAGVNASAQIVELRATINAVQEVPATNSPATGRATMLYNVATNTFDLFVTLERYSNAMTDSHVQEAAAGANGAQAAAAGITVNGPEPVRVLITAKGPSLAAFGVAGVLNDPMLTLYDAAGGLIAANDNIGVLPATSELARLPGAPTSPNESALLLVLPPGTYSALVSGANNTTGIALVEVADLRTPPVGVTN